jgi:hypothetical protein
VIWYSRKIPLLLPAIQTKSPYSILYTGTPRLSSQSKVFCSRASGRRGGPRTTGAGAPEPRVSCRRRGHRSTLRHHPPPLATRPSMAQGRRGFIKIPFSALPAAPRISATLAFRGFRARGATRDRTAPTIPVVDSHRPVKSCWISS